jgi:hypothetical protein
VRERLSGYRPPRPAAPTDKVIEEYADMWAFLAKNLEMTPYLR